MKNILKCTVQLLLCFSVVAPVSVCAGTTENPTEYFSSSMLLIAAALAFCIYGLVKGIRKLLFERTMDRVYETLSSDQKMEMFADNKRHFYFAGRMLKQTFAKKTVKVLFGMYMDLYKFYSDSEKDINKSFYFAKEKFTECDEDEIYSLLAIVMLNAGGVSDYEDCSVERIMPARRTAIAKVKCVKTIASHDEIFGVHSEKELGVRENAILVAGENGVKEYIESMVAEDGTTLDYELKGTLYIKDRELDIEYDLKKYALKDSVADVEICSLWFNTYGASNCEKCITGFVFKKDLPETTIPFEEGSVNKEIVLDIPTNVVVRNVEATGKPKITWTAVEGANKYFIYRARNKNDIFAYQGSSVDAEYVDLRAETGARYYYKVKAANTNTANQLTLSKFSGFCYIVCDLPAPVVTSGNDETTGFVQLTWEAVPGALKYEIYRSVSIDGDYRKMNTQKSTIYVNEALVEPGITYYYKVRAIHNNSYANSADSEVVTGCYNPTN